VKFIFKPFFEGGCVSTEYASTTLLLPDSNAIKGLERKINIG
jgi:hypothetical protein